MVEKLLVYLDESGIPHEFIDDTLYINGESCYVCGDVGGKVINSDFELLDYSDDSDINVFEFGGYWYYTTGCEVKLNELSYIGVSSKANKLMKSFMGVHGAMDILSGTRLYPDWVKKAQFMGLESLAICEDNTLAGAVKFQLACKGKVKSILGMTCTIKTATSTIKVKSFVKDEQGWINLLRINKAINIDNAGFIDIGDYIELSSGLVSIIDIKRSKFEDVADLGLNWYYTLEPIEFLSTGADNDFFENQIKYLKSDLLPIALYDAHYLEQSHSFIRDILQKISKKSLGATPTNQWFMDEGEYFDGLSEFFNNEEDLELKFMQAVTNLNEVSGICDFSIPEMSPEARHLPAYNMTDKEYEEFNGDSHALFDHIVEEGLQNKIDPSEHDKYRERIAIEVEVLDMGNVREYFLILWDIINWARSQNIIVGIGRGSAAGSLIAFLMDITRVNPFTYNLLFERFLNPGRVQASLPDIDVDFSGKRRDEVKEYIISRYGEHQFCDVGTYTNMKPKSLVKDLGKIEGYEHHIINEITKYWPNDTESLDDIFKLSLKDGRTKSFINKNPRVINDCKLLLMQPRAESIHACATIIVPNDREIYEYFPVKLMMRNGENVMVSQWEGAELEATGFLKEDILGVTQLDKYEMILERIKVDLGIDIDLNTIPLDDEAVMQMFKDGDNSDIFHFGSTGLTQYCKEMKPDNIHDLIAANSLYRPGPMEQGFHKQYIKRKNNLEEVTFLPQCEEITKDTYGILCYQEQIMLICQHVGGLTLQEADSIRKSMVKKDIKSIGKFVDQFKENGVNVWGIPSDEVDSLWESLLSFAKYGFNKCISGNERMLRFKNQSNFHPTISEMYRIRHDKGYATSLGKYHLHQKYKHKGYGKSYSLVDGVLKLNKIIGIRYEGVQPTFQITLASGEHISTTINHRFPTVSGIKMVKDLIIGSDELYTNGGYNQEVYDYGGKMGDGVHNSMKGHEGFTHKEELSTEYLKLKHYEKELKLCYCEKCSKSDCRLEIHHKDGNHINNDLSNLETLCVSCHKKEHYRLGRTKTGQKGLLTNTSKVINIEYIGEIEVFDVEMAEPSHTFTTKEGVVTCNSHAAAYSITAYYGQWLKCYYPLQFWATAFSFADEDNYPRFLAEIFRNDKFTMHPPHINISGESVVSDVGTGDIFWALKGVKGIGEKAYDQIIKVRDEIGGYASFEHFLKHNIWKANKKAGVEASKVNKSVVEAALSSGCFDVIEGIESPIERKRLLDFYRTQYKVKVDANKDVYSSENITTNWYWGLLQKSLCGIAKFDYDDIMINDFGIPSHITPDEIDSFNGEEVNVVGYVASVTPRKTKNVGEMCAIVLEYNFMPIYITVWSNHYTQFKNVIDSSVGSIMCFNGVVKYDSYNSRMAVYSYDEVFISTL